MTTSNLSDFKCFSFSQGYHSEVGKIFVAAGFRKTPPKVKDQFSPACVAAITDLKKVSWIKVGFQPCHPMKLFSLFQKIRALKLENLELRSRLLEGTGLKSKP